MELDRDINLVAFGTAILCSVDLGALAMVAVGSLAENTSAMFIASVGVGLAIRFSCIASAA
jgi:hypothetical protein